MADCRLQKFLAEAGVCSRRHAEKLILDGRVTVNAKVVTILGTKVTPGRDRVQVDGKSVTKESRKLYLFYKPPSVVTTLHDPHGRKCLADYVANLPVRVFSVGRLDFNVSGLLLLTNDGEYAEKLLHPRYEVKRVYWACVKGIPGSDFPKRSLKRVMLEDGPAKAKSARVLRPSKSVIKILGPLPAGASYVEIIVTEGRKHFVKNILRVLGYPVIRLARVQFGPYRLDNMSRGEIIEVKKPL